MGGSGGSGGNCVNARGTSHAERLRRGAKFHEERLKPLIGYMVVDVMTLEHDNGSFGAEALTQRLVLAPIGSTHADINAGRVDPYIVDSSQDPEGNGPGWLYIDKLSDLASQNGEDDE